jgi:hypothetical protein
LLVVVVALSGMTTSALVMLENLVQVVHCDKSAVVVMAHNALSPATVAVLSDLHLHKAEDVGQWTVYVSS